MQTFVTTAVGGNGNGRNGSAAAPIPGVLESAAGIGLALEDLGMQPRELLVFNERLKEAVQNRAPAGELRRITAESGMGNLREDALRKVQLGLTTPEEVLRAVYREE